jgi:hypothetical protein
MCLSKWLSDQGYIERIFAPEAGLVFSPVGIDWQSVISVMAASALLVPPVAIR